MHMERWEPDAEVTVIYSEITITKCVADRKSFVLPSTSSTRSLVSWLLPTDQLATNSAALALLRELSTHFGRPISFSSRPPSWLNASAKPPNAWLPRYEPGEITPFWKPHCVLHA